MERVLGVAGWQGSGKTTLLESALPELVARGWAVAVVKHDVHGLTGAPAGKDSERLRRAGADVVAVGPGEAIGRWTVPAEGAGEALLADLERRYDLVLVEGMKGAPFPKVWLSRQGEAAGAPGEAANVVAALPWDGDRAAAFVALAAERLAAAWHAAARRAGVLVGGASRRMGQPKATLPWGRATLLDHVAAALAGGGAGEVVLLGGSAATTAARLPDVPGVAGPLAGLLAALRWSPVSWTAAACDLPLLDAGAVAWLRSQRAPGRWVVLPVVDGEPQPLLAVYEPQALPLLEALARSGAPAPSRLLGMPRVFSPEPPPALRPAWRGVNTPAELSAVQPPAD